MPGMLVIVMLFKQRVVRANLGLVANLQAGRHRRRPAAKLVGFGLHRRQPIGRIAKLRLRCGNLILQHLRLLPRLGQHRLKLLIIAIERGGPLLVLLRLLSHRHLLLRRDRHRRLLRIRTRRILLIASRDKECRESERSDSGGGA